MQNELVKTYKKMMMEEGREARYPYAFGLIQGGTYVGQNAGRNGRKDPGDNNGFR